MFKANMITSTILRYYKKFGANLSLFYFIIQYLNFICRKASS